MSKQEKNALIQRYLTGQMNPDELDVFEEELLGDSNLQEAVEIDAALRDALEKEAPNFSSARSDTTRAGTTWQIPTAIAASFLVGLFTASLFTTQEPTASTVDQLVYVSPVRSSSAGVVTLTAGKRSLLSIDALSFQPIGTADLELANEKEILLTLEKRPINDDMSLNVLLPPLAAGTYTLTLSNIDHLESYELRVE